jgi:hypothetical protein
MPHQTYYCRYCKRITISPQHEDRCPDNPAVHAAIQAAITDPSAPAYAISSNRYARQAKAAGVPSEGTLNMHYGSWACAVEAFGLLLAVDKPRQQVQEGAARRVTGDRAPCPHCNREYRAGDHLRKHTLYCPQRPGIMELVRSLVEDADKPGVGIDSGEYLRRLEHYRSSRPLDMPALPALSTIEKHFGGWGKMLGFLGLITRDDAMEMKAKIDNDRHRAEVRNELSAELQPLGLPVASVQKPTPWVRVLPGGGTATMVR